MSSVYWCVLVKWITYKNIQYNVYKKFKKNIV